MSSDGLVVAMTLLVAALASAAGWVAATGRVEVSFELAINKGESPVLLPNFLSDVE